MTLTFRKARHLCLYGLTLLMAFGFLLTAFHYLNVISHNFMAEKRIDSVLRQDPANGETPQHIIVLLQGTGMNATHIMRVIPYLAADFPDTLFVAPNAPMMCYWPGNRKWYATLRRSDSLFYSYGVDASRDLVFDYLKRLHNETGVPYERIGVIGFSQGGSLALQAAIDFPHKLWGVVSYAGILFAEPEHAAFLSLQLKTEHTDHTEGLDIPAINTPLLLFHGTDDRIISPQHSHYAADMLGAHTDDLQFFMMPDAGHEITPVSLQKAAAFFALHE